MSRLELGFGTYIEIPDPEPPVPFDAAWCDEVRRLLPGGACGRFYSETLDCRPFGGPLAVGVWAMIHGQVVNVIASGTKPPAECADLIMGAFRKERDKRLRRKRDLQNELAALDRLEKTLETRRKRAA